MGRPTKDSQVVQFAWPVPETGFRWVDPDELEQEASDQEWLVVNEPRDAKARRSLVSLPLREEPMLFRVLADLDDSPDAILSFANAHGFLLGDDEIVPLTPGTMIGGEQRSAWTERIHGMRAMCHLLDAIVSEDEQELSRYITERWKGSGESRQLGVKLRIPVSGDPEVTFQKTILPRDGVAQYLEPGNYIRSAGLLAQTWLNGELEEWTSAQVLFHPGLKRQGVYVVPSSLWGALCLQYAEALKGDHTGMRRCSVCDAWLGNRADSEFCSDRCRARAYRRRQREARQLHAEGMTPSRIAKQLGSDTETVRGWLGLKTKRRS